MEITFARTSRYSVDVSTPEDYRSLAKALNVTVRSLKTLIAEGELLDNDDHRDAVARWLDEAPQLHSIVDEEDIEDLEIHGE